MPRGPPGRRVIVLSRARVQQSADTVVGSLSEALRFAAQHHQETETFIAGGARVYREALESALVDRMYLTIVHGQVEADAFFPEYEATERTTVMRELRPADERNPHAMTFSLLERN